MTSILASFTRPDEVLTVIEAYLDPGSGSFVVQALVGALLGLTFVLKTQWWRMKQYIGRQPDTATPEADASDMEGESQLSDTDGD